MNGKSSIKRIIHHYLICHKFKENSIQQLMGQLPNYRVEPVRLLVNCGIDYAGPFDVNVIDQGKFIVRGSLIK
jgi:hypothetical protein